MSVATIVPRRLIAGLFLVSFCFGSLVFAQSQQRNVPKGERGTLPVGADGKLLNFDFETGTMQDWTTDGPAFQKQPIKGPIDPKRIYGEGKRSDHTGEFWIGGFEKLHDGPVGKLTSATFVVTQPFASFLLGGGSHKETRVELVTADDGKVFFTAHGRNAEEMLPVIVDLKTQHEKKVFIRIVDEHTGGWGHVNFDDFRLHSKRPEFAAIAPPAAPNLSQVYPHAGLDAIAAAKAMQVPAGFKVQVGAAEPDVQQPVAMTIDERGRVWIAEAYDYPRRAPEGKGNDRILIFEDTNGDGSLDKRSVFMEKLSLISGLEVGHGGVWVGAAPHLLFIPDRNRDDKPDGPPEVLLDGWGYQDTHETLNAFTWGPDGWLYGCHGVFTHSKVGKPGTPDAERTPLNAGVWRFHPVRREFELFAEGTSNPWGVDFNDHGQAFITACVIPHLFHMIQGARYERQGGVHFNPHTYQDIKTIADHRHFTGNQWNNNDRHASDGLGGGHAHAGAMIYLGGAWPEQFRNQLFMSNIHGNRVNMDVLAPHGSGFVGSHGADLLLTGDQWSQMLYLRYGPDGQVWIIDWYDANQCHRNEPDVHDRSNGRIYRLSYETKESGAKSADLATLSDDELVARLSDKNDWQVRTARRLLHERTVAGKLAKETREKITSLTLEGKEDRIRLRGLWALHVTGGVPTAVSQKLMSDSSPYVRAFTIQFLCEAKGSPPTAETLARFAIMAREDVSPIVRLYLASALQRLPLDARWDILSGLLTHAEDATDHNLPLMYWYAAEPLAGHDPRRALALALVAAPNIPLLPEFMIRRIGSSEPAKSLQLLIEGLQAAKTVEQRLTFLRGMNEALKGTAKIAAPGGWKEAYVTLSRDENSEVTLLSHALGATFGDANAIAALRKLVADSKVKLAARRSALTALVRVRDPELATLLTSLLSDSELRGDALRGLAVVGNDNVPTAVLAIYAQLSPTEQRDALATLCSRATYARELLNAIEQRKIPAAHLSADLVRQMRNLKNAGLDEQIARVWIVRESTADKVQLIAEYKAILAADSGLPPDLMLGRAVFAKTCQQCHTLFATGGKVGPDLTGSNRVNVDYLLSNILDPSAVMAKEYQPSVIVTTSGRVITGIVRESSAQSLTVQTANETLVIPRGEVDELKLSEKSMMPDDLLKQLGRHEVRSLAAYLASVGQSPLLASADNLVSFFNTKDLARWVGDEKLWSVENGEIIGRSPGLKHNAFLVSELALEDFRLAVDVKLTPNGGNSGIQFRSQPQANGEVKGLQADIGVGWWGKVYEELGRGLLWDKSGEAHVKLDDWNRYEIAAVGSRVRTWINGQPCADLDDSQAARRGVIALQIHSGGPMEVRFRNFHIERISAPPPLVPFRISTDSRPASDVKFARHQLDEKFRTEGVAYGDFNNDGLLDIATGSVWYQAPDWKMTTLLEKPNEFNIRTYGDSFCNWAEDVNHDGRQDLIVVDFPGKQTWWFENPGMKGGVWPRHQITAVTNNESPNYLDVDRDGVRELLLGYNGGFLGTASPTANPQAEWRLKPISVAGAPGTERFSHGLGIGDINSDGRDDVMVTAGWWEALATHGQWKFHPAKFGEPAAQMHVFDFDGDGDADVLSSSAHRTGIWWHEQLAPDEWKTHEIDTSIAQTHAMCLADMNGDGLPDFVTGKRYYAHNGRDPGEDQPAVLAWYELQRVNGRPVWTPHEIDHDSGVGTQFEVVDLNRDGRLDVIVGNKKGVFYFEQK